ncbi:MAG: hypothetical protein LH471_06240 [Salinibacterium sp.]|nr:hypothetical protein [Salinibacterium sp.]
MTSRNLGARAVASAILASALVIGTTGCTFITQQATLIPYSPSDGIDANLGDVKLRNVIALMSDDGLAASLLITIVNDGDARANVRMQTVSATGEQVSFVKAVPGNSVVSFGNTVDEEQLIVLMPDAIAGGLLPVYVQQGTIPGTQMLVPALAALDEHYLDLKPAEVAR